jgi:hypothetical protein
MKAIIIILLLGMFSCASVQPVVIVEHIPVKPIIKTNPINEAIDSADMYQYKIDENRF